MPDDDKKRAAHRALVDRVLSGEGRASAEQRARAFSNDGLSPPLHALSLAVAQKCNLGCTYCYASQGSFGGPAKISLCYGNIQQRIAISGSVDQQRFTRGQRLGKLVLLEQRTNPGCVGSVDRCGRLRERGIH